MTSEGTEMEVGKTIEIQPFVRLIGLTASWLMIAGGVVWGVVGAACGPRRCLDMSTGGAFVMFLGICAAGAAFLGIVSWSPVRMTESCIELPLAAIYGKSRIVDWADIESVRDEGWGVTLRWQENGATRTFHIVRFFHRLDDDVVRYMKRQAENE